MTPLSTNDVIKIARHTSTLTNTRNNLIMIGVMPKALDAGITNMWRAYSNLKSDIPDEQMFVTRSLDEAMAKIDTLLSETD